MLSSRLIASIAIGISAAALTIVLNRKQGRRILHPLIATVVSVVVSLLTMIVLDSNGMVPYYDGPTPYVTTTKCVEDKLDGSVPQPTPCPSYVTGGMHS